MYLILKCVIFFVCGWLIGDIYRALFEFTWQGAFLVMVFTGFLAYYLNPVYDQAAEKLGFGRNNS
jgi:hypothetical protein